MAKRFFKLTAFILLLILCLTALGCKRTQKRVNDQIHVCAEYFDNGLIGGFLTINYNKRYRGQENALFSVNPNIGAFGLEKPLRVLSVTDGVTELDYNFLDESKSLLSVKLDKSKKCAQTIKISFVINLERCEKRLGVNAQTVNLGNWLILPCAYLDGKFVLPASVNFGDPFVSECADFKVELTVPSQYTVASSGLASSLDVAGDKTKYIYAQDGVRDFCFVLSKNYSVDQIMVEANEQSQGDNDNDKNQQKAVYKPINYYFYGEIDSQSVLDITKKALTYFTQIYGEYPYETLSVCNVTLDAGGMEYPALVMVSDRLPFKDYCYALVHEIAHQWWYGVVGTNQIDEPFIDEGLAEFSTALFFESYPEYGITYQSLIDNAKQTVSNYSEISNALKLKPDLALKKGLYEFKTQSQYVALCYKQSFLMFDSCKNAIGKEKLLSALAQVYARNAFGLITKDALFYSLKSVSPVLKSYYNGF